MEQMDQQHKTGKGACPKCKDGFVVKEPHMGTSPPGLHCVICGWYEWFGFTIRKPSKQETMGLYPDPIKNSHKKKPQLTFAGQGARI